MSPVLVTKGNSHLRLSDSSLKVTDGDSPRWHAGEKSLGRLQRHFECKYFDVIEGIPYNCKS